MMDGQSLAQQEVMGRLYLVTRVTPFHRYLLKNYQTKA